VSAIDFDALARAAGEEVAARVLGELPRLIDAALARHAADRLLDSVALAEYLGLSVKAVGMRLSRARTGKRPSALAAIALQLDGRRVWRKADVDGLVASGAISRRSDGAACR
jgi:hypothetical protein